jgi:hypothetical protein
MTNLTWASAIKNHPGFKKSTESIGSIASIIIDIHNLDDLDITRINQDIIPFTIAGFGSNPVAITFNPRVVPRLGVQKYDILVQWELQLTQLPP